MPLTWPDYTDDDFSGTSGEPLDKALFDAMRESIEEAVFSTANPTISPGDTTDEVVDARGDFDTLDERLDDIEGQTGGGGDTDPNTLAASENIARNPDLAAWKNGAALAPDHFTLSGTGAAVARAASLGAGAFSAAITFGADAAKLTQDLISIADFGDQDSLGTTGRKCSLTVKVSTAVTDQARIVISDGVTTTESDFHTGSGNPEDLTVTHEISGAATKLSFYFEVAQAGSATFAGVVAVLSDAPSPSWQPPRRSGRRILDINITPLSAATLMRYKVAPSMLRSNGVTLHVVGAGYNANTNNTRTLTFIFGSFSFQLYTGGSGTKNKPWSYEIYVARIGTDSQAIFVPSLGLVTGSILTTQDDASEQTMGFSSNGSEITQQFMLVEILETSAGI